MKVSITKTVYNKFKGIQYAEETQNIFEILYRDSRLSKGILTQTTNKINFKSQIGGKKKLIELSDGKIYEYHIDTIVPYDDTKKQISFMNITETSDNCVFLFFDTRDSIDNTLYIQSISNHDDCIKSDDKNHVYKVGDILMQIIIKLIKKDKLFSHIKQIELTDLSKKMCYDIGLELKYLRTITHGIPFYAKYGFRPKNEEDYDIFKYNRNNYKLNRTISNIELYKIILDSKVNKKDIYKKYFYNYIKNTNIIDSKILLIDMIKLMDNINDINEKKEICNFIKSIYKKIFRILGYKEYQESVWILKMR